MDWIGWILLRSLVQLEHLAVLKKKCHFVKEDGWQVYLAILWWISFMPLCYFFGFIFLNLMMVCRYILPSSDGGRRRMFSSDCDGKCFPCRGLWWKAGEVGTEATGYTCCFGFARICLKYKNTRNRILYQIQPNVFKNTRIYMLLRHCKNLSQIQPKVLH